MIFIIIILNLSHLPPLPSPRNETYFFCNPFVYSRQSSEDMLVNAALKNNLLASQKMNMFGDQKTVADDETSFIAKNAAALQEFLSNKVTENKISGGGGGVVASAASAGGNLNKHD